MPALPRGPFRSRRAAVLGAALAACTLTACTGTPAEVPIPSPLVDPCVQTDPSIGVPDECRPPQPSPSTSPPSNSSAIAAVPVASVENELARVGNTDDPTVTRREVQVVVPAGGRLRSTLACSGVGTARITTRPISGAEQEFPCEFEGEPVQLTVEDGTPLTAAQTYMIVIEVGAPSRWTAVLSWTNEPLRGSG